MKIEIKQETKLLDFVLSYFAGVSVTKAKKMILYNCFFMGGASLKSFEYVLHKGDTIEYRKYSGGMHIAKEKRNVSVVYEDEDIIVVNKSSFQSVYPNEKLKQDSITQYTKQYLKRKYHKNEVYVVFSPENDESGLCILSKSKYVLHQLEKQRNSFKLHISAIVNNELKHKTDKIAFYYKENKGIYYKAKQNDEGCEKVFLQYKTIDDLTMGDNTMSQIDISGLGYKPYLYRFILSQIGNPVVGDNVFDKKKQNENMLKYCIYSVEFLRPSNNRKLKIETTLPNSFTSLSIPRQKIIKTEDNNLNK